MHIQLPSSPLSEGIFAEVRGVQDLGRVEWQRKTFHSESNIWPIGYRSVRFYASRRSAPQPWPCASPCGVL